ncbi:MAG: hypothetical protein ABEJ85_00485 [Haloarculaceae archaeon]
MSLSAHRDRIRRLAREARDARQAFDPPEDPPDEERARELLREGFGPTLSVYVDARSGDWDRFGAEEFEKLETAMNVWLDLYAACYGVDHDPDVTARQAAEALIDTHNVYDVARILTGVPGRSD